MDQLIALLPSLRSVHHLEYVKYVLYKQCTGVADPLLVAPEVHQSNRGVS